MTVLTDLTDDRRFQQVFADAEGIDRAVWADYAIREDARVILHVEADPALRGSGAAGRFMQALAEHARSEKLRLVMHCSYAAAWMKRHPEYKDVLA